MRGNEWKAMLQKNSQYEVIKGSTAGVTHTCDRVFRRGSTFKWQAFTFDPGMGAPFVWMLARCPSCKRLFIHPPRLPAPELVEALRNEIDASIGNRFITFRWPEELGA